MRQRNKLNGWQAGGNGRGTVKLAARDRTQSHFLWRGAGRVHTMNSHEFPGGDDRERRGATPRKAAGPGATLANTAPFIVLLPTGTAQRKPEIWLNIIFSH